MIRLVALKLGQRRRASLTVGSVLFEILPSMHPIHAEAQEPKFISNTVFMLLARNVLEQRVDSSARFDLNGRQRRPALCSAGITEEKLQIRLREQREIVILHVVLCIEEVAVIGAARD